MRFLHISDTHRHQPRLAKYPGYIIHTGDATDHGSADEYLDLASAVEEYADRLIMAPGNHDYGTLGNVFSRPAAERFDRFHAGLHGALFHRFAEKAPLVRVLDEDGASSTVIVLNSCATTFSPHDLAEGEIGRPQLDALDRALAQASGAVIVALHHHPFVHSYAYKLKDAEDLGWVIEGRVDVLLFGHHHYPGRWSGRLGVPHILAADDSSRSGVAREIEILPGGGVNIITRRLSDI